MSAASKRLSRLKSPVLSDGTAVTLSIHSCAMTRSPLMSGDAELRIRNSGTLASSVESAGGCWEPFGIAVNALLESENVQWCQAPSSDSMNAPPGTLSLEEYPVSEY